MAFVLRRAAFLFGSVTLLFWCSCEEHKVGELPEVQREHVDLVKKNAPNPAAAPDSSPKMGTTPAEFFSPAKKSP